jgi:hypothetical protein
VTVAADAMSPKQSSAMPEQPIDTEQLHDPSAFVLTFPLWAIAHGASTSEQIHSGRGFIVFRLVEASDQGRLDKAGISGPHRAEFRIPVRWEYGVTNGCTRNCGNLTSLLAVDLMHQEQAQC